MNRSFEQLGFDFFNQPENYMKSFTRKPIIGIMGPGSPDNPEEIITLVKKILDSSK